MRWGRRSGSRRQAGWKGHIPVLDVLPPVVLGLPLMVLGPAGMAGAEGSDLRSLGAVAAAQGVRASVSVPGFLLVESVFDGGGPITQAVLDPLGAQSFASLPYPGDTALSLPGLVAAGGGPTLPAYPLYVNATTNDPDHAVSDPAGLYALRAQAGPAGASSQARLGPHDQAVASGSRGGAEVSRTESEVKATAESVTEGITLSGGALRIGTVLSRSSTVSRGSQPETTTELVVEGGRAGNLAFGYGPDGLSVNGQGVPVPAGDGLAVLNTALEPAGITLQFFHGEDQAGGRSSDALLVNAATTLPSGQAVVLHLRFGGTSTAVSGNAAGVDLRAGAAAGAGQPPTTPEATPGGNAIGPGPEAAADDNVGSPLRGGPFGPAGADGAALAEADGAALGEVDGVALPEAAADVFPSGGDRAEGGGDRAEGGVGQAAAAARTGPVARAAHPSAPAVSVAPLEFRALRASYWALVGGVAVLLIASWWWRRKGALAP